MPRRSRHLQLNSEDKRLLRERFKNFSLSDFIDLLQELPRPLLLAFRSQGLIRNNAVALGVDDSRRIALQVNINETVAILCVVWSCFIPCSVFYLLTFVAGVGCMRGTLGAGGA
jgi:hypothetical protein